MKTRFIPLLVLVLLFLGACQSPNGATDTATASSPTPTYDQSPPSPTSTPFPMCTPPSCAENEAYHCPDECPGGCGTVCATHTPAPDEQTPSQTAEQAALTPTVDEPEAVRFAVIGDYGLAGPPEAAVATLVMGWQPDLIITTGDNNYPDGSAETIDENIGQYYHSYIHPYQGQYGPGAETNRFFPTLGNHDWTTDKAQPHLDYFELPGNERYYDFTWGPVHFFAISSDSREPDGVGRSSNQAQWLQAALANSTTPWQVVYFHQPAYTSGITHGPTDWMQWPFAEWGADVVLAGHEHLYERLIVDGIPHITVGLSGYPALYTFGESYPGSQARYRDNYGALLVEADQRQMRFRLENIEAQSIDTYLLEAPQADSAATAVPQPTQPADVTSFPDPQAYAWTLYAQGFEKPLGLEYAGDGSERLFVLEQPGVIRILQDGQLLPEPFLDIRERVGDQGNEQGLLGLAFHPDYIENGYFYLNYTDTAGDTVIARFNVSADANRADPESELKILGVSQPYANHNGGDLTFGPDGYLYIGLGDGGSAGDPQGNAQDLSTLLGKLLRIDVDRANPYGAPSSNPFIGQGRSEVWAWGLRNPWRFTFDPATGDIYIADVGQNQWEEINYLPAGAHKGANFGWDYFEGSHSFEGSPPPELDPVMPVWEYDHSQGCSITGGVVYRGSMPAWQGIYLYGDFCSGKVWGLLQDAQGEWQNQLLYESGANITAFSSGPQGEVYLIDRSGRILRLERTAP